jgi:hypothetical protein
MKFWTLWIFDALVALVFLYFFVIGITDGSVSSFNIVLWLGILGTLASVLGGALLLRHLGHALLALGLLLVLATPAILGLLFFLFILISNPRWN